MTLTFASDGNPLIYGGWTWPGDPCLQLLHPLRFLGRKNQTAAQCHITT